MPVASEEAVEMAEAMIRSTDIPKDRSMLIDLRDWEWIDKDGVVWKVASMTEDKITWVRAQDVGEDDVTAPGPDEEEEEEEEDDDDEVKELEEPVTVPPAEE